MKRKILAGLTLAVLALQFVRPEKNLGAATGPDDAAVLYPPSPAVQATLQRACYDCHSDRTRYPWYAEVQPVGWWLASHVSDGRRHLNFSQFGRYDARRAARKMNELIDEVNDHEMPLASYTWLHRDAALADRDREAVETWARHVRDLILAGPDTPAPAEK